MLSLHTRPTEQFREDMNRIFGNVLGACSKPTVQPELDNPQIDVWEESDGFVVEAELPGVRNEWIDVQALGRKLTLKGQWREAEESANSAGPEEEKQAKRTFYHRECHSGEFQRVLMFPKDIDTENVEACLADGLLTVKIPKAASAKPRKIQLHTE